MQTHNLTYTKGNTESKKNTDNNDSVRNVR